MVIVGTNFTFMLDATDMHMCHAYLWADGQQQYVAQRHTPTGGGNMNLKRINDGFAVTEQISSADVEALAAQGVKSLICNRPDGESPDQPAYSEIEATARRVGMAVSHIPVVSGQITDKDVHAFGNAYNKMPNPLVAYCRTGTRSITLWALDQGNKGMSSQEILSIGSNAGYDLGDTIKRIENGRQ